MKITRHITKLVLRILSAAVILVVLIFLTGAVIIKVMFTPEHLNAVLTDQLQQIFQRPVYMESATIVVLKGIRIKGLRVLDAPDFPTRDFISGGVFTARYKFLPLLGARLVLTDMKLISPVIQFVRRQDGSWNFSDIMHNYRLRMKHKTPGLLNLGVDSAQISDGTLTYVDLQRDVQHTLYGVSFSFSDFSFKDDFPLSLSFLSKNKIQGNIVEGGFGMKGMVNLARFKWQDAVAKELELNLTISGKSLKVSGEIYNFINPEVSAVIDLPDINSRDISLLVPFPEGMSLPSSRWTIDAVFLKPGRIELRSAKGRIGTLSWQANGRFDFSSSTSAYRLWVQGGPFELSEISKWWKNTAPCAFRGKARFNVTIDRTRSAGLEMPNASAVLYKAGGNIKGFGFSDVDLVLSLNNSFKEFSFKVSNGAITNNGQEISSIRIDSSLSDDTLKIRRMSAKWDGSPLKLRATVSSIFSGTRKAEIMAFIKRLDITKAESWIYAIGAAVKKNGRPKRSRSSGSRRLKWLRDFRNALPDEIPVSSGWIGVEKLVHPTFSSNNLKIAWSLKGLSTGMQRLSGKVCLDAGPGLFYHIQGLAERKIFYKVAFAPFLALYKMDRMGVFKVGSRFKDLNFSKIGGDYDFESGRMRINNFYIDGTAVSACSEGSVNWVGEKMNLTVYTIFKTGSSLGGLSENLTDAGGRPALAFNLEGSMEKPSRKMLSPKKNGKIIEEAINRGIRADFRKLNQFIKGD